MVGLSAGEATKSAVVRVLEVAGSRVADEEQVVRTSVP